MQRLREGPRPEEQVTSRSWDLLSIGLPVKEIIVGIDVLGHAPWTTTCVEQGHSITSSIRRQHGKYGRQILSARAMVQQSACLFFEDPLRRKIRAVSQRIARLQTRRLELITGRHAYCKMLSGEAKRMRAEGRQVPSTLTKHVIKSHGKL